MTDEVTESIADALTASYNELNAESETETEEAPVVSEEATQETEVEAEAETEVEEDGEESEEQDDETSTVFQAPEHWSSDEREGFDSLPPEAQEILLARDKSFQTGYQEKAQAIAAVTEALEPWKDNLAQRGVTADQAIRTLFAAQHSLDTNPIQGILQIAQSYGVVDQLRTQFAPTTDEDDFTDPEIKALRQTVSDLQNQMEQTTTGIQQQNNSQLQQQIDSFQNAKDESGVLKHPYFEQLKPQMAHIVNTGKTLEQAYEEAVWTVPEYRQQQLDAQGKATAQKTEQEKAEKVKRAKKAARGVKTNGKASPDTGAESLSLHEDLSLSFQQHSS